MEIIVTDVTNMKGGHVCIAGIDPKTGICVRPQKMVNGNRYLTYAEAKANNVQPGSILRGDFRPANNPPHIPHVEDFLFSHFNVVGVATANEFQAILESSSRSTIEAAFGKSTNQKWFAENNPPQRSIATLKLNQVLQRLRFTVDDRAGQKSIKAHILDAEGVQLQYLPVKDRRLEDHTREILNGDYGAQKLKLFFATQQQVYLRLGIGRAWAPPGETPKHWLQVNGIYSFPSYKPELSAYV
ncbi:hypothetical protein N5F13_14895 [Comamonas thiooxydans]|uniref:dual OB domain-containing protein n=1 Tax=Comamonas thiooxydans TaxID=363952 RepID=UPI002449338C|nr:hypothetical protein [Comamonas thiooxydans]MDH1475794.1 hypothetical protein [Comamonas thiooxydans]